MTAHARSSAGHKEVSRYSIDIVPAVVSGRQVVQKEAKRSTKTCIIDRLMQCDEKVYRDFPVLRLNLAEIACFFSWPDVRPPSTVR